MQLTEIKKVLFYVIIFTIVLIGWVIVKNRTVQDQLPSSITPAPSPTSSVQASSATSDLKTYTNKEWGFEFKYPNNWTFHENTFYSPFSKFNLVGAPLREDYQLNSPILVNIVTSDFADRAVVSRKNLGATTSDVVIAGIQGEKYEYMEELPKISIDIPFGEYRIILGTEKQYKDVFSQILASFKFTK